MSWLQVTVAASDDTAEYIEGLLEDLGALSITMVDAHDDPVLEPDLGTTPLWSNTQVVALFSAEVDRQLVTSHLEQHQIPVSAIHCEIIEDRDWEREWMTHFQPMQFGQRLWICPSWQPPQDPNAVNLLLDPGLAFGTGTHPTTALCLEWLDGQNLQNQALLDFGCGSGVLAIAGLLLGASSAVGTDIDPQALDASLDNAERNGVEDRLTLYLPDQLPEITADIVVANILANPLIALAPTLAGLTRADGSLALSGILREQEQDVRDAYEVFYDLDPTQYKEDWVLISGKRKSGI
ncbi:ribosomal protein L11 methyltransferase [Hahella sp. CCB-MM4]|uniref:50S ribosomal protein L11 methyltransferase n=1 Tax=Hahella sp. (strain CCB-MM4) TaxID=1926491 RepID=UPI000B9C119A|nr:50S ribosomal protein L11 methyltransferase [Hahella sp. CCB-MM4]OZG71404.1 ribosomal protein L11 methyltransferase [Hahella sp. CCB-MM4]